MVSSKYLNSAGLYIYKKIDEKKYSTCWFFVPILCQMIFKILDVFSYFASLFLTERKNTVQILTTFRISNAFIRFFLININILFAVVIHSEQEL
jgi:hypothetical protein